MAKLYDEFKCVLRPVSRGKLYELMDEWGYFEDEDIEFLRSPSVTKTDAVKQLISVMKRNQVSICIFYILPSISVT